MTVQVTHARTDIATSRSRLGGVYTSRMPAKNAAIELSTGTFMVPPQDPTGPRPAWVGGRTTINTGFALRAPEPEGLLILFQDNEGTPTQIECPRIIAELISRKRDNGITVDTKVPLVRALVVPGSPGMIGVLEFSMLEEGTMQVRTISNGPRDVLPQLNTNDLLIPHPVFNGNQVLLAPGGRMNGSQEMYVLHSLLTVNFEQ